MISIEKLLKYAELIKELQQINPVYGNVIVEMPEDTPIKETWSNGSTERFHSVEFTLKDLDHINRKLYDKLRYFKLKNEESEE